MTCSHPVRCQCDGRGILPGRLGPNGYAHVPCPCNGDCQSRVINAHYDCEICGETLIAPVQHNHHDLATFRQLLMALDDIGGKMRMGSYHDVAFLAFIWEQNRNKILAGETTWQNERRSVFKE